MKRLHRITGIIVSVFIVLHLFNHAMAWFGADAHQQVLETLRKGYRIPAVEILLVGCFVFQAVSGVRLFWVLRNKPEKTRYERLQMYSGLLLGYFLLQHIPATIGQRFLYDFDTNFYFAARVVTQSPWLYYFVPYYAIGVVAVGLHIANVHSQKMRERIGEKAANVHFYAVLGAFVLLTAAILYALMGGRFAIVIPDVYNVY